MHVVHSSAAPLYFMNILQVHFHVKVGLLEGVHISVWQQFGINIKLCETGIAVILYGFSPFTIS